jgi:hypothetical protein
MQFFTRDKAARIIENWLNGIKERIINEANAQGRNLQNKIPDSIKHEITDTGTDVINAKLYGWKWILQAWEVGRGPTVNPNSGGPTLAEKLERWVVLRGIETGDRKKVMRAARAIAYFIHKRGTKQYRTGQASGVISESYTQNDINELKISYIRSIKDDITALLKARNDNSSPNT